MLPTGYASFPRVLSVSQVAHYLKELLEIDDILQDIWVQGEVSDCKTYPSGHCYFTLKDGSSQLLCVFFKHARLRSSALELRNGMALAVNGRVSFYERDGKLQLYVDSIQPIGEGALFLRFEQLKARLAAEGLFEDERKRPLPPQPAVIGIVTSLQAAALRDMLRVLRTRYPLARVILSAATAAVPDIADWQAGILAKQQTLIELIQELLEDLGASLQHVQRDLQRASPRYQLESRHQQLDDLTALLQTRLQYILSLRGERLRGASLRLHSLSPLLTIARGYAVVRLEADHTLVSSVQQVKPGDELTIQVTNGHIRASVHL